MKKTGNSAELNLFAVGCLKKAGIEAYPVIISTRDHGKIKSDYPYVDFFNNVIIAARIGDNLMLTDVTDPYLPTNRIPENCINDKGLIINKDRTEWVELHNNLPNEKKTSLNVEISGHKLLADITISANDYYARDYRAEYADDKEKIREIATDKGYSIEDSTIRISNLSNLDKPYIVNFRVSGNYENIADKIYISPFLQETPFDNPFKQRVRTYPIDFGYPIKQSYTSTIKIPDGYEIDYLPQGYSYSSDLFEIHYKIDIESGNILNVAFDYFFKYPVYYSKEYTKVKYYFHEIVKRGNEKIVLKKS